MFFLLLAVRDYVGFFHGDIDPVERAMIVIAVFTESFPSVLHLKHSLLVILSPHQILNTILAVFYPELRSLLILLIVYILLLLFNRSHRFIRNGLLA